MKTPSFSVIIPVYNTEKYISKCIQSVLQQTYTDFEIVIVNDCSQDDSQNLVDKFQLSDSRIRSYTNIQNIGLGGSRNFGIKHARGRYIVFLDSDDWLEKNMLQLVFEALEITQAEMAIFRYYLHYSSQNYSYPTKSLYKRLRIKSNVFSLKSCPNIFDITSSCMKVYKKDLLIQNNIYFPVGLYYEDIPFSFKCYFSIQKGVIIDKPLYYYRQHEGTITKERGQRMLDMLKVIKLAESECANSTKDNKILRRYHAKKFQLLFDVLVLIDKNYRYEFFAEINKICKVIYFNKYLLTQLLVRTKLYRCAYLSAIIPHYFIKTAYSLKRIALRF